MLILRSNLLARLPGLIWKVYTIWVLPVSLWSFLTVYAEG